MEKQDSKMTHVILKDFQGLKVFTLADDLKGFSDLKEKI